MSWPKYTADERHEMKEAANRAALLAYQTHNRAPGHVAVTGIVKFNIRHPEDSDCNDCRDNALHLKILRKWQ
jgi:hypothetical protein